MEYLNNKNILKNLVGDLDRLNTVNGGTAAITINVENKPDHFQITILAPTVPPEYFEVYTNMNNLIVNLYPSEEGYSTRSAARIPVFNKVFSLPAYVDASKIEAVHEGNVLRLVVPFKEGTAPGLRKINIKTREY
jgi:HSP20 family protein